jgi:hypothetical protein
MTGSKHEIPFGTLRFGIIRPKEAPIEMWDGKEWAMMSMKNFEGVEGECKLYSLYYQIVTAQKMKLINIAQKYDLTPEDEVVIEDMLK